MSHSAGAGNDGMGDERIKVFVSYARKDKAFVERLVAALEVRGLSARIDVRDLPTLEDWRRELLGLIEAADAVVFVISPNAIASAVCGWEIERVAELGKRLAPIVLENVPDDRIPVEAAKINYLFFDPPNPFEPQVDRLAAALQTDVGWLKEQTRIGGLALRWNERGRAVHLLARGGEVEFAESWLLSKPRSAPEPTVLQRAFVETSRKAETRRQRRTVWLSTSAGLIAVLLSAAAVWQRQVAVEQRQIAERNLDTAIDTTEQFVKSLASDLKNIAGLPAGKIASILDTAKTQFDKIAESAPDNPKLLANRAGLYLTYAETYQSIGRPADALDRATEAQALARRLTSEHPRDAEYARLAEVAANRIGLIEGRSTASPEAVASARAAAKANPNAPDFQRDLVVSLNALGDRQRETGDLDGALASYREAIGVTTALAGRYGEQGIVKNDLALSYSRLGNLYQDRKEPVRAIESYSSSLKLTKELADDEPWNTEWQRNLAIAHEKVGNLKLVLGDAAGALEEHKAALLLHEALLRGDPQSVVWKSDLAICMSYLAGDWLALGERDRAMASEQTALDIIRSIIEKERTPAPRRRRQLEVSLNRVAGYLADAGESQKALTYRREALGIARELVASDPGNQGARFDVFLCQAGVAATTPDLEEAKQLNVEVVGFYRRLQEVGRDGPELHALVAEALGREASLQFLAKNYAESERIIRQTIALVPQDLMQQARLAGALMFQGKTEAADAIYRGNRGAKIGEKAWETVILDAFAAARSMGIEHPHMAVVEQELRQGPK